MNEDYQDGDCGAESFDIQPAMTTREVELFYSMVAVGKDVELATYAPSRVQSLLKGFDGLTLEEVLDGLPPLCDIQHHIEFIIGVILPLLPHYRMPPYELVELAKEVIELLKRGLIVESFSPSVVSIILTSKMTKTWRMCFDAKVVFKIDLGSSCHHIRIREHGEWKTTFKIRVDLYEWLVLLFGLSNETTSFMRMITQISKNLVGKYVVMFLDDVLIDMEGRIQHLKNFLCVFQMLQRSWLFINFGICLLLNDQVVY